LKVIAIIAVVAFGVAVDPQYRSRGIARLLLRAAFEIAREAGADRMMLKVHTDNPNALHLYASEGFVFESGPDASGQLKGISALRE
jgi:ribosomal protein S18 acetylase RimI-like enzyme